MNSAKERPRYAGGCGLTRAHGTTHPRQVDGVSLLTSVLRYWLTKGNTCPNVLVSTHFHSVMQQKLLPQNDLIEYLVQTAAHNVHVHVIDVVNMHTY